MKRNPSLEPFSRDHNVGLILVRQLIQSAKESDQACRQVAQVLSQYWKDELEDHFVEEEELLTPLIPDEELRSRLVGDHRDFAQYVGLSDSGSCKPADLESMGRLLNDHIRWEERVLFPSIERTATTSQLSELLTKTTLLESRRSHSAWSPRRGELMRRREEQQSSGSVKLPDQQYRLAVERWETEGGNVAMGVSQ